MGDLSSRRGRPLGTEAVGGMTEVKAEVPMAEILTYAPDLRSLTGGQGEYTMEFLRYEEVPAHLAQKVVDKAQEEEAGPGPTRNTLAGGRGSDARHPDQPGRHRLRRLRAHAAARRARRDLPGRRLAPRGVRPVHGAGAARGLDPRVRAATSWRCAHTRHDGRGRSFLDRLRARRERAREVQDEMAAAADEPSRRRTRSRSAAPGAAARARATSARCRPTPT